MRRWYCWNAKGGRERLVHQLIGREGFESYLPLEPSWGDGDADVEVCRPLFPGYGFVWLDLRIDNWVPLQYLPGMRRGLLRPAPLEDPIEVPDGVMAVVRATALPRVGDGGIGVDDVVRVTDGPFASYEGLCRMAAGERVVLLLRVMGRETRVSLSRRLCERVG